MLRRHLLYIPVFLFAGLVARKKEKKENKRCNVNEFISIILYDHVDVTNDYSGSRIIPQDRAKIYKMRKLK